MTLIMPNTSPAKCPDIVRPCRGIFIDTFKQVAEREDHGVGQCEVPLRPSPEILHIGLATLDRPFDPATAKSMMGFFLVK